MQLSKRARASEDERMEAFADLPVAVGGWATLIFGFVFWPLVLIWAYVDAPAKPGAKP